MRRTALASILLVLACGGAEPVAVEPAPARLQPLDAPATPAPAPEVEPVPSGSHLLVLGTAQDGGIPHAACDCERCRAARDDPARMRYVSSIALVLPDLGETYLFDATPDIRPQLQMLAGADAPAGKVNRRPVSGVFLTHAHIGHYLGLAFFGFEAVHTRDLPVYGTPAMVEFLTNNAPWSQLVKIGNIAPMPTEPGHPVTLGDVTVSSVKVPHRDEFADTVAYVFQGPKHRAVFIPDTDPWARWAQPVDELFEGADILLVDATFYSPDELPGRSIDDIGHPLMTDTMDRWAEDVKAGRRSVHFIHLNHSNPVLDPSGVEAMEVKARGFEVLAEGRRIEL